MTSPFESISQLSTHPRLSRVRAIWRRVAAALPSFEAIAAGSILLLVAFRNGAGHL
jgi:hypothetical protein